MILQPTHTAPKGNLAAADRSSSLNRDLPAIIEQFRLVPLSQVKRELSKTSDIPLINNYPPNIVFSSEIGGVASKGSPEKWKQVVVRLTCEDDGQEYWVSKSQLPHRYNSLFFFSKSDLCPNNLTNTSGTSKA